MKYTAILTDETSPEQSLADNGIWVVSIPFGQENYDVDKLDAFIERLKTASSSLDVLLTGGLNVYNFQIMGQDLSSATASALEREQSWIMPYQTKIDELTNKNLTLFSRDLVLHNSFNSAHSFIQQLYNGSESTSFKKMVMRTVGDRLSYISNIALKQQKELGTDMKQTVKLLVKYILEECALVLQLREMGYSALFYIGKLNSATAYIADLAYSLTNEENQTIVYPPLKIHTVAQFQKKTVTKSNKSCCLFGSAEHTTSRMQKLNKLPQETQKAIFSAFFDSPSIPCEEKIKFIENFVSQQPSSQHAMQNHLEVSTPPAGLLATG